ncbi:hypothetical protein GCM10011410_05010 [Hoyosella rhizosphaerae]|uniref:Uncharacterized protein n=1 Tax=Hoyosella rhizosphaerae TaxID=1755582 RepID=A0A916U1E8_9ACTN|nr:hypothetical protein GCM10011410_05010 [Hoyosella rhizosphaerae]
MSPILVVMTYVGIQVFEPKFDNALPEFERVVEELHAQPGYTSIGSLRLGGFEIYRAYDRSDGQVFFVDATTVFFWGSGGWAYSPDGPPSDAHLVSVNHIVGDWYHVRWYFDL